jgi:hypothetical protein
VAGDIDLCEISAGAAASADFSGGVRAVFCHKCRMKEKAFPDGRS